MEADDIYNGLNREFITALKQIHGTAFLGSVNFHGEDHKLVALGEKVSMRSMLGNRYITSAVITVSQRKMRNWRR